MYIYICIYISNSQLLSKRNERMSLGEDKNSNNNLKAYNLTDFIELGFHFGTRLFSGGSRAHVLLNVSAIITNQHFSNYC